MLRSVWLLVILAACSESHTSDDAPAFDTPIAEDTPPRDAPFDGGCVMPLGPTRWVSTEVGRCLRLGDPGCISCHERGGGFALRPMDAPPPPPGVDLTIPPGMCGLCIP